MKIVVDTNIVFSAILNTKSKIGQLIINGSKYFDFFTIELLKYEIYNHKDKIIDLTDYTEEQFTGIFQLITSRMVFVDDILLTDNEINKGIELVTGIDQDDAFFVALNNHLKANLWTGDKKLINGLKKKGYKRTISTDELYEIYLDKQITSKQKRK
jgi:predicted nucleic acid-binding protein